MSVFKTLQIQRFQSLLKPPNPRSISYNEFLPLTHRTFATSSPEIEEPTKREPEIKENKKALHSIFQSERSEFGERGKGRENNKLLRKFRGLEMEVKNLAVKSNVEEMAEEGKLKQGNPKRLFDVFTNGKGDAEKATEVKREEPVVFKDISPDMETFINHLYGEGYFKDALFSTKGSFISHFQNSYGRGFIRFAVDRFGKDKQEIAKWLSGSDLKKVALFGCPSFDRRCVFAAKRLRKYFEIPENTVCSKCILSQSCKFVNRSVWRGDTKNLNLADVLKVITSYALESMSPQLAVPDDIKASISRVLKEILKLSQTA